MSRRWLDAVLGCPEKRPRLMSRRELLRLGLAAGAGLLSAQSFAAGRFQHQEPRILIIGAGFSGLACAYELASAGYETKVLEARKRVGGRVHSLHGLIPGKNVEGGAEMLGSNHPHVLAYAARFGFDFLHVAKFDLASCPVILGGRKLKGDEVKQISQEIDTALETMTDDARAVVVDEPWKTANALTLDQMSTSLWIERLKISPLAKALMTVQFTSTNGVVTDHQSYLGNLAQVRGGGLEKYWTDTEAHRLKGGNQQYAERLAKELGPERVLLDSPVREIICTRNGVTVVDRDGQRHLADDVVLAVPPSVWSNIKFSPALPDTLNPQMGMNVKYLAVVKGRFWRAAMLPPNATTDEAINQTWEGTDGQGDETPMALVAFSGGPAAELNHKRPVPERQPAYLKAMEALYPGFGEQFLKGQFMDWIGDPWTRAGYSFPAPGQVTTIGPALHAGQGRLHFAGEHTCYQFVGYMEGALHSGASLARRLAIRDGVAVSNSM